MQRPLFYVQLICLFFLSTFSFSQILKSPSEFLEYPLGSQFTYHYKLHDYLKYLSFASNKIKYIPYGKSEESRQLFVLAISSEQNIKNLEEIRLSNLKRAGFIKGIPNDSISIVWLGYNVHGNEASGSEVAMKLAYNILDENFEEILQDVIIIIDPCLNPDGRDRYVNNYRNKQGIFINNNPSTWEHYETWPSGRFNHYLFDLNRDWAWQTQIETQQRSILYRKWYPHVFVDFHEMMPQYSYFFGPSADPIHEEVTAWQKKYHKISSDKYSHFFKSQKWDFFTEKIFDLLYPSYGDSWTCFNGAVGFTFEQGGHGVAGLSYQGKNEDELLTLKGRIEKHYEASLLTILLASEYKAELLKEFEIFFASTLNNTKQYIIKNKKEDKYNIDWLISLLSQHGIVTEEIVENKTINGYSFIDRENKKIQIQKGDVVFSTNQLLGKALKVLLEPKAVFTDSSTYDLTAWSLPYAFGLDVIETDAAIEKNIKPLLYKKATKEYDENEMTDSTFFVLEWESIGDVKLIIDLMQHDIKVGYLSSDLNVDGAQIKKGTILLPYFGLSMSNSLKALKELIDKHQVDYNLINLNNLDIEKNIQVMDKPLITIVGGEGVNPVKFGNLWYYFDKILNYPVNISYKNKLSSFDLIKSNTLILSDGKYDEKMSKLIESFLSRGGKVILLEDAITVSTSIENLEMSKQYHNSFKNWSIKNTDEFSAKAFGCIIEVELLDGELISKGLNKNYYLIKENSNKLPLLENGFNIGVVQNSKAVSGFIGKELEKSLQGYSLISAEKYKKGEIYYFVDDPLIRGFWGNGMHLLSNAIFYDIN